jgi:uncharacterized SAM-binding protein YcdF (DUF218 family)
VTAALVFISPLGIRFGLWGLTSLVPPDSGDRVDAIVVLGRGSDMRDTRIAEALKLWQSNRAQQIFVSGRSDAQPMVQTIEDLGVPGQYLSGEECSLTTEENALFTSAFLHSQGLKKIVLITDSPHILRSLLTFQSYGFHVIPHPSPQPAHYPYIDQIGDLLREYAGLAEYNLTGKFNLRPTNILDNPPANVTQRISNWNCQVKG